MRSIWRIVSLICLLIFLKPLEAQDGLNLSADLYVLYNQGSIDRFGVGAIGVQTITPENVFVLDFGVAPDGNWIAYRTTQGLVLSNMFNAEETFTLEGETASAPAVRGSGETLIWSPDEQMLAYTTLTGFRVYFFANNGVVDTPVSSLWHLAWSPDNHYLAVAASDGVWWIYRVENQQITLASIITAAKDAVWVSPTEILFAPPTGGLTIMDLANGNTQTVLLEPSMIFNLLLYDEPNQLVRFFARPVDVEAHTGLYYQMTLNGVPELLGKTAISLDDVRWASGGNFLVAFQGGVLALIDPITGQGFSLPMSSVVAYGWGPVQPPAVGGLELPDNGYFLADDPNDIQQVWRLPKDGGTPLTVTPSTEDVSIYAVSYDESSVAYFTQDSLYLFRDGGEEGEHLLSKVADVVTQLLFTPDGKSMIYRTDNDDVWLISIESGIKERILSHDPSGKIYTSVQHAPNIRAILVEARQETTPELSVFDLVSKETISIGAYEHGFWLRDGRIVAYNSAPSSEIVLLEMNTPTETTSLYTLPEGITLKDLRETRPALLQLLTTPNNAGPAELTLVNIPIGGRADTIHGIPNIVQPRLSPDGLYIGGYTYPNGKILVYNLRTETAQVLRNPIGVQAFRWHPA